MTTKDQAIACSQHPDAPHGFNRNSSHTAGRYVCDCEGWMPDDTLEAQSPAPDCRTCDRQEFCITHHVYDDCINGDQYQPAPALVLWRTE